ncbi:MAG TPA: carboxypeptidase regulatory-like domain-containing protein, partial [Acidobacteriota bacterium]|nr:carboxypeptidase regulatory-like domain-containing protein [Acidobacteriota bacterium]
MHVHARCLFRLRFGIRLVFWGCAPFLCSATQAAAQIGEIPPAPESSAQTQQRGTLSGIVLDVEGQPVPGALIRLFGPNRLQVGQTESGPQGKFLFAELNPGNYELHVTVPPFRDRVQLVEVTPQGALATVNFAQIEESVTVTANRGLLQDETKVAGTIRSLTLEMLEERAPDLLPRMLTEENGIIAQQTTPGQGSPILRGQSAQAVLYLIDGIRY